MIGSLSTRRGIGMVVMLLVSTLLLLLSACALLNQAPIARIAADVLSGESPLTVTFDGGQSRDPDPDGTIMSYAWTFGDGDSDTGAVVEHTYFALTETKTYTATLTVTDDNGAKSKATQSIEVRAGTGGGGGGGTGAPTARIDASRLIGSTPLQVVFDASESEGGGSAIVEYDWDFGDGAKAVGSQVTHTFSPEATEEFTVTLFVWNADSVATEQVKVLVIVPGAQTGGEDPHAEIAITEIVENYVSDGLPTIPSLYSVTFNPQGSYADAGHQIEYYAWDFGDGEVLVETTNVEVTHLFELRSATHTYITTLTVYDEQGLDGSALINVTLPAE